MKSREIRRLVAADPWTVFLVDLPEREPDWPWNLTGKRETVPCFIRACVGGRAYLAAASPRRVPETFPVQMIVGVRGVTPVTPASPTTTPLVPS